MKRLVLLGIVAVALASQSVTSVHLAPVDAVTIGPRHGQRFAPLSREPEQNATRAEGASKIIRGMPMATIPRARDSAREQLTRALGEWLRPSGLPDGWQPPPEVVDRLVQWGAVETIAHDYGTVYIQQLRLDTSEHARQQVVEAFERQEAGRRLVRLGGLLGFILTCLLALTTYIRADEATRGYYTNQLRLAAITGVGATGYALYRILS